MRRYATLSTLFVGALALIIGLGGCDLTEFNENPNQPTSADPNNVLANAQRSLAFETFGGNETMRGTNLYAQYTTQNQYVTESRYGSVGYGWDSFYTALNDLKRTKDLASNSPNAANIQAVATIMQVWTFQILTDAYGDIPFTEALQGSQNRSPAYTPQEEIYPALLGSLDTAIGQISTGTSGPSGDLIHGGDMQKWQRFAYGLKMRIGIRAADQNPSLAESAIQDAMGNALQSNADNTYFQFGTSSTHRNTYYDNRFVDGRDDFDASDRFVNAMQQYGQGTKDPRMDAFFEQTSNTAPPCEDGSGNYEGFQYGLDQQEATEIKTNTPSCNFSRPEAWWGAGPSGQGDSYNPMMYYDEILLTKAEAAARGLISGGDAQAKDYLEQAIRASIDFYGNETDADISGSSSAADDYVQSVRNDYDSNGWRQVIGEQRWIAFYFNDIQGWSAARRLDFSGWLGPPEAGIAGDFGTDFPLRIGYPSSESTLNQTNYEEAAERQFGGVSEEDAGSRIWWDTN